MAFWAWLAAANQEMSQNSRTTQLERSENKARVDFLGHPPGCAGGGCWLMENSCIILKKKTLALADDTIRGITATYTRYAKRT